MTKEAKRQNILTFAREHTGEIVVTVKGFAPIKFNPAQASLANRKAAEFYGWKQRLADTGAVDADPETGKTDPAEKHRRILKLVEFYEAGGEAWTMKAAPVGFDSGLVIEAMIRALGKTLEEVEKLVAAGAAKRDVDREAMLKIWATTDKVAPVIVQIKAERAAGRSKMSADDLLDELDEEGEGEEEGEETSDE